MPGCSGALPSSSASPFASSFSAASSAAAASAGCTAGGSAAPCSPAGPGDSGLGASSDTVAGAAASGGPQGGGGGEWEGGSPVLRHTVHHARSAWGASRSGAQCPPAPTWLHLLLCLHHLLFHLLLLLLRRRHCLHVNVTRHHLCLRLRLQCGRQRLLRCSFTLLHSVGRHAGWGSSCRHTLAAGSA